MMLVTLWLQNLGCCWPVTKTVRLDREDSKISVMIAYLFYSALNILE